MTTRKSMFALAALATVAAAALAPTSASAWGHGGGFHGGWGGYHGGWNHWGWRNGWRNYGYGYYRPEYRRWWPPTPVVYAPRPDPVGYAPQPIVDDGPPPVAGRRAKRPRLRMRRAAVAAPLPQAAGRPTLGKNGKLNRNDNGMAHTAPCRAS